MSAQWYINRDGEKKGPFKLDQLIEAARSGKLRPDDMIWGTGMASWARADEIEALQPHAWQNTSAAPPPPVATTRQSQTGHLKLEQLSRWMGFVGIMTIIGGVISAISGVFAFIVGAIPGIITIILGVMLRKASGYADRMQYEEAIESYSANFGMFIANLNSYFKILGILIIISLVLGVLSAIFAVIAGSFLINYLEEFIVPFNF